MTCAVSISGVDSSFTPPAVTTSSAAVGELVPNPNLPLESNRALSVLLVSKVKLVADLTDVTFTVDMRIF